MNKKFQKDIHTFFTRERKNPKFIPGETYIPVSGKVYDEHELSLGIQAVLDGWWTEGRFAKLFERKFASLHAIRYVTLVNSGSSANLIALSALTSTSIGKRTLQKGDEVITVGTGFPTTINPIILNGCIPVFVDVDLETKNILIPQLKKAINKKTKAIMIAHTLGNPFNLKDVMAIAKKHNLWVIEDCCDALGATYLKKPVGTFGDIATFSFYPAHQITMGEGGAVITNNPLLHRAIRQFRDWGRDCWCDTGKDNTCGRRFAWKFDGLPFGYDHKYIYSQIGYNLKLTDMQASIGLAQLDKLPAFVKKRNTNFTILFSFFSRWEKYFILPRWEEEASPSWFGFMLIIRDKAPFSKLEFVKYLEENKIGTRSLFGGNLTRHPAYTKIKYRKMSNLKNSDKILEDGFWIGVFPGITRQMTSYIIKTVGNFLNNYE